MNFWEGFILGNILSSKRDTADAIYEKDEYRRELERVTDMTILLEVVAAGLFIFGGFTGRVLGLILFFLSIFILIKEI